MNRTPHIHTWRKSSYSDVEGNCVEVAHADGGVAVRDSKNPGGGHHVLTREAFAALIADLKGGR